MQATLQKKLSMKLVPLVLLCMFPAAAHYVVAGNAKNAGDGRPNILFIYTDDQRWDAMGVVQKFFKEQQAAKGKA